MTRVSGYFAQITRLGATTAPTDGPGHIDIGDAIVSEGSRTHQWVSWGVG